MKTLDEINREAGQKMEHDRFVARAGRLLSRALKMTCSQGRDIAKKLTVDEAANLKALLELPDSRDAKRLADETAICQRAVDDLNARLAPKKAK